MRADEAILPDSAAACVHQETAAWLNRNSFKVQRSLSIALPALSNAGAREKRLHKRRPCHTAYRCARSKHCFLIMVEPARTTQLRTPGEELERFPLMESLIGLLERRLDNVVFRLGFAPSITAARRLVENGHIQVNRRSERLGSVVLQPGEVIWLTEKAGHSSPPPPLPSYLQFQNPATPDRAWCCRFLTGAMFRSGS